MAEIRRARLADQAADALLDRIAAGEWAVGEKLPTESVLTTELGIGRSSLREAIRLLAARGVVESRHGSGVYLTAIRPAAALDDVLRERDIVSVLEARLAIETEAARLAARRHTRVDAQALADALDHRAASYGDAGSLVDADIALHRSIVAASHNDALLDIFDGLTPRVQHTMVEMIARTPISDVDADIHAHRLLVEAITASDEECAYSRARAHLDDLILALSASSPGPPK